MSTTEKKSQPNKGNSMQIAVILTVIIMLAIAVLVAITASSDTKESSEGLDAINLEEQPVLGDPNAKVTIVEFADFKCPGCKAWSQQFFPEVKKRWIDTGIAKLVYIHVNFHGEESVLGSLAGEALWDMHPDAYWTFVKSMFDAQPDTSHDALWVTKEKVTELAKKAVPSLDETAWLARWTDERVRERMKEDEALVRQFQIRQTPTIIIDGTELKDPFDLDAMQALIER